jgi:uridine kinase
MHLCTHAHAHTHGRTRTLTQARQQRADVDYDSIESMDVELVQEHIVALTQGLQVTTPIYNMKARARVPSSINLTYPPP